MPATSTESHRIYWQQWIAANAGTSDEPRLSRRELITSSAALRLSAAATARDVVKLLRKTMELSEERIEEDSLVIVGTLYSLTRGYVQFVEGLVSPDSDHSSYPNHDPFHVVKTIDHDQSLLKTKESMQRYLDEQLARAIAQSTEPQRSIISPKSQFFYIPTPNLANMQVVIPNCVELDGYSTDMDSKPSEEEWIVDSPIKLYSNPTDAEIVASLDEPWLCRGNEIASKPSHHLIQNKLSAELHLAHRVRSGILLKRSRRDPNVWRQVQCILTNTDLWFVSRKYYHHHSMPFHGRLGLTRALLLQPSQDYLPLLKTPYAWEVVGHDGKSHWFRASCKKLQQEWIAAISEGIVNAYEASLFENAESRVTDEAKARNQRAQALVVAPFQEHFNGVAVDCSNRYIVSVLQWGMEVADYREICRNLTERHEASATAVERVWARAESLWYHATKLVQQQHKDRAHSHADTLCQHIDFMITGRRRRSADATAPSSDHRDRKHSSCPPIDLLDPLLAELQKLAASTQSKC